MTSIGDLGPEVNTVLSHLIFDQRKFTCELKSHLTFGNDGKDNEFQDMTPDKIVREIAEHFPDFFIELKSHRVMSGFKILVKFTNNYGTSIIRVWFEENEHELNTIDGKNIIRLEEVLKIVDEIQLSKPGEKLP